MFYLRFDHKYLQGPVGSETNKNKGKKNHQFFSLPPPHVKLRLKKYEIFFFILLKINKIPKKKSVFSVRYRLGTDIEKRAIFTYICMLINTIF
jgi:hypothetical protein